jgi:Domain of unknown function (DUF4271)
MNVLIHIARSVNRSIWMAGLLWIIGAHAAAQTNPFDLVHRLPRQARSGAGFTGPSNPFDVVAHRAPGAAVALDENATQALRPFRLLPHGNNFPASGIFWLLTAMLGLLAFSVAANRNAVGRAWRSFLADSALASAQRDASGLVGSTPYYLLYINFLLNAGIFVFLIARVFNPDTFNNFPMLLICIVGAPLFFLFKHMMLGAVGQLFPVKEEATRYNFLVIIFNCVLGLFLVPFNFWVAFGQEYQKFLIFWVLGLVAIFYAYRAIRAANIGSKFLVAHTFHFLLYLCVAEIAPLLVLVKIALQQVD